jgi:hypothetical protein
MDAADIAQAQQEGLAEAAQIYLKAMRKLGQRIEEAEDDTVLGELASGLHKLGRSHRQTLALQAKFARDAEADARQRGERARKDRKAQVRAEVSRLIWDEYEQPEAEDFIETLDEILDEEALHEAPYPADPAAHVAEVCRQLGLQVPPPPSGGGGPLAERREEPMVEGASPLHGAAAPLRPG